MKVDPKRTAEVSFGEEGKRLAKRGTFCRFGQRVSLILVGEEKKRKERVWAALNEEREGSRVVMEREEPDKIG